jgi:hypothetical protein
MGEGRGTHFVVVSADWKTRATSLERYQVYSPARSRHGYLINLHRVPPKTR